MKFIKQNIKKVLINRCHREYAKMVNERNLSYDKWIKIQEKNITIDTLILRNDGKCLTNDGGEMISDRKKLENEGNHSKAVDFVKCPENGNICICDLRYFELHSEQILQEGNGDIVLLMLCYGMVDRAALNLVREQFNRNQNIILIYGDEDMELEKERTDPWFRPDWSPDRFLSSFYLGNFLAIRRQALAKAWEKYGFVWEEENDIEAMQKFYLLLYEMIHDHGGFSDRKEPEKNPVYHIRQMLFHCKSPGYGQIRKLSLPEEIQHGQTGIGQSSGISLKAPDGEDRDVSIIIPSKDNPEVLFCCIRSLIERTHTDYSYEILIIDNGSSGANRQKIQNELELLQKDDKVMARFHYIYHPMQFNFSQMCNLGVQNAKGRFLLFLNDDMEIVQENWLDLMAEKAALPYAGGVGVKLLYPNSSIIQHVGITNLRVGPAHKLQFLDDHIEHYYGMNRGVHNMLAVTGACLMMRREVFEEAGGFCPELAVAFNDVDLCYTIYEKGYYNIVRNDVVLYHHESLSRGKDGESEEKQLRLLREKDMLYERHQDLYGKDPFYHPYLTTDMLEQEYSPACRYRVTLEMPWSEVQPTGKAFLAAREDACLVVGMECAMDIYKWKYGVEPSKGKVKAEQDEMGYYFQGYSFVIGADNACYHKKLLLKEKENGVVFEISLDNRYRQDIKNNLGDQLNVDLTGFAAKLQMGRLPKGTYQFGMLAYDRCSRTKLVNWSSWTIEIK